MARLHSRRCSGNASSWSSRSVAETNMATRWPGRGAVGAQRVSSNLPLEPATWEGF